MRAFLGPWSARRTGVLGRIEVTQVDAKTLAAEENLSRRLWFLLFAVYYATMARIDLVTYFFIYLNQASARVCAAPSWWAPWSNVCPPSRIGPVRSFVRVLVALLGTLRQTLNGTLLSLVLSLSLLLVGIVLRPFKARQFWTFVIVYTETMIFVKYIFQVRMADRSPSGARPRRGSHARAER